MSKGGPNPDQRKGKWRVKVGVLTSYSNLDLNPMNRKRTSDEKGVKSQMEGESE